MATSVDGLAMLGGRPVRTAPFPKWPVFDEREEQNLLDVLRSGEWGTHNGGRVLPEFEKRFAEYHRAEFAVGIANGSVALEVALIAAGIGRGDEVITTPFTFITTTSAILRTGARPVYVDIQPDTYLIDPELIEGAITERTKAILPVHLGGRPVDLDRILDLARGHHLAVIEDACQAWGAEWRGKRVGALGDVGAFSFQLGKNITSGEGGMLLTNRQDIYDRCASYRNVGRIPGGGWYQHEILGWNCRLTEFQAAILLPQLERLPEHTRRRTENAHILDELLSSIPGIEPMRPDERITQNAWHYYLFRYDPAKFNGLPRPFFLHALRAEGIPVPPVYQQPLPQIEAVRDGIRLTYGSDADPWLPPDLPIASRACASEGIWLTQNVLLGTREDMTSIAEAIAKVQRNSAELAE